MIGRVDDQESRVRHAKGGVEAALATTLASVTSRRKFLRRAFSAVTVAGTTVALGGSHFTEPAYAANCGPSPYCPTGSCLSDTQQCNPSRSCKNATYGHTTCDVSHPGCWLSSANTLCCDCCCPEYWLGSFCPSDTCGSTYKCICQFPCC